MNRRRYQRTPAQYYTKYAFLNENMMIQNPPGINRAIIENISFGGVSLIILPEIKAEIKKKLKDGKLNIYLDFNLPPSLKQIEITGKVKWIKDKILKDSKMSIVGVEFVNKNQALLKEIDDFIKSDGQGPLLKNKRRFSRIPASLNVKFSIRKFKTLNLFSTMHEGFVHDLSAGGMSLVVIPQLKKSYINSLLSRKKYLFLKFFLPESNRFLNVTGVPVRIRNIKINDKPATFMGVKFINISERDQHELIEYIACKKATFVKENVNEVKKEEK